jgi:hypothetical protein
MNDKKFLQMFSLFTLLFIFVNATSAENIDPNEDGSQYAYGENIGWVNFEPNLAEPNVGATVTSEKLTGFIWGESIGWINLGPNGSDPNTGIANDGAGNLSGFAWGEGVGWINFDPNVPGYVNHYGVIIDSNGDFSGWAWGENIGWINFNSAALLGHNVKARLVWYVDKDNTSGTEDGTSWATAFTTVQAGINAASAGGGEVWVAEGMYRPDPAGLGDPRQATFQLISSVAVYGGFAGSETSFDERNWQTNETVLSGDIGTMDDTSDNSYHVVTGSGTDETAVLDGFTITAGNANKYIPEWDAGWHGGGMVNWGSGSPTVANCTFTENSALDGGGMCNYHGSPTVTDCTFSGNSAGHGGGMFNVTDSNPTVNNCIFSGNSAEYGSGGGMFNWTYSNPILTNCTFSANSASGSGGGGLSNYNYCSPTLTNCRFSGNSAGNGGGMYNRYFSDPTMTNCIFSGNSANYNGGAMFTWDSCILTLSNCTFSQNSALNGTALACDEPHGFRPPSTLDVNNCILWDGGAEIWNDDGSTITINYSDVQGGETGVYDPCDGLVWGAGNIDADPCFVDAANGDYHLLEDSPCIDAGDNTAVPSGVTTDLDDNPRFVDDPCTPDTGNGTPPIVDMGAYEF